MMRGTATCVAAMLTITLAVATHAGSFTGVAGDREGQALPHVVITLKPIGRAAPTTPPEEIIVSQQELTFKPYISVLRVGSSVVFANRDRVEHHIKSFSSSKPFEIAVHKAGDTPAAIRFDKEGAVVAYCLLHDWMRAYVYVAETPWFALTRVNTGIAKIDNVPAGDYEVTAWHPDLGQYKPPLTQRVTIAATGNVDATFKFDVKPRTIRQAPKVTGSGKTG
jgi:plastocyanin